jgi:hypothetical protein
MEQRMCATASISGSISDQSGPVESIGITVGLFLAALLIHPFEKDGMGYSDSSTHDESISDLFTTGVINVYIVR